MKFDIEDLKESSEEDYEKAWRESGDLLEGAGEYFSLDDKGSSHPLFDLFRSSGLFSPKLVLKSRSCRPDRER